MVTRHTGIPMMRFRGAYPPCSPAVYIAADVNPFCAGETVTFTPTLVCLDDAVSYSWIVESVEVSTSSSPYSTNTLVGGNRVILKVINSLGQSIYSNMIIVQEKTEGCITLIKYGLLYNWYAATDARNICADGWEVPEQSDYLTLITNTTNNVLTAGGPLKETGSTYWGGSNVGATNEYGFNARGAGWRIYDTGAFDFLNTECNFMTITESGDNNTLRRLSYANIVFGFGNHDKNYGSSIRLIKTTTTLTHGQTGTYTGNDGKLYRTICIGTQEWLAANLAETLFRDLTPIPEVTDNAAWVALTTAGMCAYGNDWNNV